MTATLLAHGTIRASRPLVARASGEVFGTEVSLLTNVADVLGETLKVTLFNPREGGAALPDLAPGQDVSWIVECDSGRYGLSATFRRAATSDDVRTMEPGIATFAWDDAPAKK